MTFYVILKKGKREKKRERRRGENELKLKYFNIVIRRKVKENNVRRAKMKETRKSKYKIDLIRRTSVGK